MLSTLRPWWLLYACLLGLYAVFAYGLTASNLVLSSFAPFWQFQTWMWATFFQNRPLLTSTHLGLVVLIFAIYLRIYFLSRAYQVVPTFYIKHFLPWWLLLLAPLLLGYNALSHDIFNYIFNARMILLYQANPYHSVALDFPQDTWTRFMHNVHTPAPYGYAWTALSLLPYSLGLGKFLLTWLIFKGLGTLSLLGLFLVTKASNKYHIFATLHLSDMVLLFLNPLLLLEFGLNAHNDLWMMIPGVASFLLLPRKTATTHLFRIALSFALLLLSASIKLSTMALVPMWLLMVIVSFSTWSKIRDLVFTYWPVLATCSMLLTLFTPRSFYFHPWYLGWVIVWLPFFPKHVAQPGIKAGVSFLKLLVICFSLTSLLRYLPWLWTGDYPQSVIMDQRYITYAAVPLALGLYLLWILTKKAQLNSR